MPGFAVPPERLASVSDAISSLLRRCYGKGPRRSRAYMAGDTLIVLLEGGFLDHEETFIDRGHGSTVRAVRQEFQELICDELTSAVEEHTGLRVVDYVSDSLTGARRTLEAFVLADPGDVESGGSLR